MKFSSFFDTIKNIFTNRITKEKLIERIDDACKYAVLVSKIKTLNPDNGDKLRRIAVTGEGNFKFTDKLVSAFVWSETEEGLRYWIAINNTPLPENAFGENKIKKYYELTKQVAKFDQIAAEKLLMLPFKLKEHWYGDTLISAFEWETTEEGHTYWKNLHTKLNTKNFKFGRLYWRSIGIIRNGVTNTGKK